MGDEPEADPFEEAGRTVETGRIERLGEIVRQDKGDQALNDLRNEFQESSNQLSKKHEAEVERVSEQAYLQGVSDILEDAMEFQQNYAKMANELIAQCYDEDGNVDIKQVNERLSALKDGRQAIEAAVDRAIGKAKTRSEVVGKVDVIHQMQQIVDSLEQPDEFDYDA